MSVPAMVVGVELNGLGVVRSLSRAGIRVIAVDDDLNRPAMHTRYGRKRRVRALHGSALVEDLIDIGRSLSERPVLFVTMESSVQTVARHRDELAPYYRLTFPDAGVLDKLMHKESFQRFAERHQFRVPRSLHIVDDESLSAAQSLRYPVILKPARKEAAYGRSFEKAYRVESFGELGGLCRKIMPVLPDLIVQEWIEGADADVYFCLQYINAGREPVASFTGRKIRSWPPATGGTASCVAAPEAEAELEAETTRFFRAAGFTGMGSMEFKRDAVTGAFYLIEPTVGRTDYQEEVATLNGANIPLAAWCAEVRVPEPARASSPSRVVWRERATDQWSAELQHQRCGHGPLDKGRTVDAWWRWYDPMPAVSRFRRRLGKAAQRRLDRVWMKSFGGEGI